MVGNFNISYKFNIQDKNFSSSLKKFDKGIKKTDSSLKNVARTSKRVDSTFKGLGSTIVKTGGYFAAFFGARAVVNTISTFGQSMSKVKAITNATGKEMLELRNQAKELGKTTKFTASQTASAQAILAQKGKTVNEILKTMPGLLSLASAGNIGLEEATSIVVGTMNSFKVEASETNKIADQMAFIASKTGAGMANLGRAFVNIGADANSFGFSVAETSVLLGVLANNNILNERAGTGVKIMFQRLVKPVGEVKAGLNALGLTTEDVTPALHDSQTILNTLRKAFEKQKDPVRRAKIEMAIYGSESSKIGKVLVSSTKEVEKLNREILLQAGLANKLAIVYEDNLGGDILKMKSAMEGLTLQTGDGGLTGALRSVTQASTTFFRNLGQKDKVDDLTDSMKGLLDVTESIGRALKKSGDAWGRIFAGISKGKKAREILKEDGSITSEALKISRKSRQAGLPISFNEAIIEAKQQRLLQASREKAIVRQVSQQAELRAIFDFGNVPTGSRLETSSSGNMNVDVGTNMSFAPGGI